MSTFFQEGDSLDVVGLGEHVEWLHSGEVEPLPGKFGKIPAEGCRIAGNVNQPVATKRGQQAGETGDALTGWVNHHAVELTSGRRQFLAGRVGRLLAEITVGQTGQRCVVAGAANGRTLAFYAKQRTGSCGQRNGEVAGTAEQVEYRIVVRYAGKLKDQADHLEILRQVHLAEASDFPGGGPGTRAER